LQVERRAADDLEYLGGRRLLLQRFAQVFGARAQLTKQPRVFDCDDGLSRELFQERYLLLRETRRLLAKDHDIADHLIVLQERNGENTTRTP
jgi:hypothetical protein